MSALKRRRLNETENAESESLRSMRKQSPNVRIINANGDLILLVPDDNIAEAERQAIEESGRPHPQLPLLVSSKVLTLISPTLRRIAMDGPFELLRTTPNEARGRK